MPLPSTLALRSGVVFALSTFGALGLTAQAVPTAQLRMQVQPYALASYVRPAYGGSPASTAVTLGVDLDGVHVLPALELGLDVRGVAARSTQINETSLVAGPRLSYRGSWLQPYGEYLFGLGRGTFNTSSNPDYQRDYSAVRSYGAGFDVRATRDVTFRADAQYQRWRFTYLAPYFHPVQVSLGIGYRLHLHSRTGPQY